MIKKIFLILIFNILLIVSIFSQLKINGFVEIGMVNQQYIMNKTYFRSTGKIINRTSNIIAYETEKVNEITALYGDNNLYTDIVLDFSIKNIHFEQQIYNIFVYDGNGYSFKPLEILYRSRLYYEWKFVQIGYDHMCFHPIITNYSYSEPITKKGAHDKIFLRFIFEN